VCDQASLERQVSESGRGMPKLRAKRQSSKHSVVRIAVGTMPMLHLGAPVVTVLPWDTRIVPLANTTPLDPEGFQGLCNRKAEYRDLRIKRGSSTLRCEGGNCHRPRLGMSQAKPKYRGRWERRQGDPLRFLAGFSEQCAINRPAQRFSTRQYLNQRPIAVPMICARIYWRLLCPYDGRLGIHTAKDP
jgi:hypothetical protein